ncbi:MAG: ATP-binding cassette domain-containing protein [Trichlorobacter sp.]|uniref:ATP-binding cassette domain-containing protein n=1 Tax=Trichlorobacter sp. TaxID=2911007 RepID=UPI00256073EA|nr:ATP-binding cassette domain-containing protein [Trichlorobacter sp.]MDK9717278.1 ATP-binding cassette domain-containing protein [Trichlorobacter sp.]
MDNNYADMMLEQLFCEHPHAREFFGAIGLSALPEGQTLGNTVAALDEELLLDVGIERHDLLRQFRDYMAGMEQLRNQQQAMVASVTVLGGHDKSGNLENFKLELRPGEVTCIVGPTGSGKSRFLADIEWLAQGDSPTGRSVLINGTVPDLARRYAVEQKLVAQLSQNMNFVMDLSAEEFIRLHAESRMVTDPSAITATILDLANSLAGEQFIPTTPVTALSGGQSRALMIADVACLSSSPIVLIDEIENAGIDRKRALELLADQDKIVLMATHDPILALMGQRRLIFKNGGVASIRSTSPAERANLALFEQMDARLTMVRNALRNGEEIAGNW